MSGLFELLFKYRPLVYQKGVVAFRPLWPWYVSALLALTAIIYAIWVYRRAAGAIPERWRWGLSALRAVPFLLILLIFLQALWPLPTI
jgi:hypothetical protein